LHWTPYRIVAESSIEMAKVPMESSKHNGTQTRTNSNPQAGVTTSAGRPTARNTVAEETPPSNDRTNKDGTATRSGNAAVVTLRKGVHKSAAVVNTAMTNRPTRGATEIGRSKRADGIVTTAVKTRNASPTDAKIETVAP
jgi:hypothetical protein